MSTCAARSAPDDIGILVALKDRLNALKNPYAHLHEPDITYDSVKESFMLWEPIRYSETCPSSDGAFAMVLAGEDAAEASAAASGVPPAWIHGTAMRSEPAIRLGPGPGVAEGRQASARPTSTRRPASPTRVRHVDVVEMYVPFSWYEPMWLENLGFAPEGEGWKMTESGATQLDGDLPVNCSGGVLSTNPIGASGMIRFGEAAMQVRGQAGDHQIDGAEAGCRPRLRRRRAVLCDVGCWFREAVVVVSHIGDEALAEERLGMWVVGSEKP